MSDIQVEIQKLNEIYSDLAQIQSDENDKFEEITENCFSHFQNFNSNILDFLTSLETITEDQDQEIIKNFKNNFSEEEKELMRVAMKCVTHMGKLTNRTDNDKQQKWLKLLNEN